MGTDLAFSAADIANYLRFFGIYYPTYVDDMDLIRSTFNPCEWYHSFILSSHLYNSSSHTMFHIPRFTSLSPFLLLIVLVNRQVRARH